jgi:hypothetical protein
LRSAAPQSYGWLKDHPRVSASKPIFLRKVGSVTYDNLCGLGQVPNNAEMNYQALSHKGFCVLMRPSNFLNLATPLPEERTSGRIAAFEEAFLDRKDQLGIATPILYVDALALKRDLDSSEFAKVAGHEGRHRIRAIQEINGDEPTLVHLRVGDMYGLKDLPGFFRRLSQGIRPEHGGRLILTPITGLIDGVEPEDLANIRPW